MGSNVLDVARVKASKHTEERTGLGLEKPRTETSIFELFRGLKASSCSVLGVRGCLGGELMKAEKMSSAERSGLFEAVVMVFLRGESVPVTDLADGERETGEFEPLMAETGIKGARTAPPDLESFRGVTVGPLRGSASCFDFSGLLGLGRKAEKGESAGTSKPGGCKVFSFSARPVRLISGDCGTRTQ
jgi:hypothetical protein